MDQLRVIWAGERDAHLLATDLSATSLYRALIDRRAADQSNQSIPGVAEITPGSNTLQVRIHPEADPDETIAAVRSLIDEIGDESSSPEPRVVEIPVCYDPGFAPDLGSIASNAGLSMDDAADLHASGDYTVRLLGFSPGFPYIDGLAEPLHSPRLDTPRTRVRAGSVGIAGARTGIYPQATPGGWRLIGATPLTLFDPTRDPPALLAPGDRVRFRRIDSAEFDALSGGPDKERTP